MSREERAELEARLRADDEDDDDDPVELSFEGKTFKGSFRRVAQFAEAHGVKLTAPAAASGSGDGDGGDGGSGSQVRRFGGRRVS